MGVETGNGKNIAIAVYCFQRPFFTGTLRLIEFNVGVFSKDRNCFLMRETMFDWCTPPVLVTSLGALVAAITDYRFFRIYNALTLPLFLSAIIYHFLLSGWSGLFQSLSGALFGLAILLLPFAMGGMGAGDVKLLAAVGAWLGLPVTISVFVWSALFSGICACVILAKTTSVSHVITQIYAIWFRLLSLSTHLNSEDWSKSMVPVENPRQRVIPYGVMIAMGIITTVVLMSWFPDLEIFSVP